MKQLRSELGAEAEEAVDAGPVAVSLPALARPQPLWLVECGNFVSPASHYPVPRAHTHLRVLAELVADGPVVVVPGSTELQLTAEQARDVFAAGDVALSSCNVESRIPELALAPYAELASGWYVVGVSSWLPAVGEPPAERWWELADPVASVRETIARLPRGARIIVVAQYQPAEVARELAALPITMLVGCRSDNDPQWPAEAAPAYPAPPGRGEQLVLVSLSSAEQGQPPHCERWEVELDEAWPDDEAALALLAEEQQEVKRLLRARFAAEGGEGWRSVDWSSSERYLPPTPAERATEYLDAEPRYLGDRECRDCHAETWEAWRETGHARAFTELMAMGEHETLDCLACHVTGLLAPGGFNPYDRQDGVSSVSCEACHGPGSHHVGRMILGRRAETLGIERGLLEGCAQCHDSYNSPSFEAQAYWERIAH